MLTAFTVSPQARPLSEGRRIITLGIDVGSIWDRFWDVAVRPSPSRLSRPSRHSRSSVPRSCPVRSVRPRPVLSVQAPFPSVLSVPSHPYRPSKNLPRASKEPDTQTNVSRHQPQICNSQKGVNHQNHSPENGDTQTGGGGVTPHGVLNK